MFSKFIIMRFSAKLWEAKESRRMGRRI